MVIALLVAPTRDVVAEDAPLAGVDVIAAKEGHHREALHCHAEVAAKEGGKSVSLAVERQRSSFDLFVVLELDLEQAHEFNCDPCCASDADDRLIIRGEDLLDVALSDEIAHGGAPVSRHHDAALAR